MDSSGGQVRGDHLVAFASALSLQRDDDDPGPREVVVGGPGERRILDRRDWSIGFYAQLFLVHVEGDLDRILAVRTESRRMYGERFARDSEDFRTGAELVVAEIAERAASIVREAGAEHDRKARERLVAAARRENRRDAGVPAGDPNDLAEQLNEIDRS